MGLKKKTKEKNPFHHMQMQLKRIQVVKSRLRGKKQEETEETDKEEEEEAKAEPKTRKPFFGAKKETAEEKRARRSAGLKAAREAKAGKGSERTNQKRRKRGEKKK